MEIHKRLLGRLSLCWIALSLVIGSSVYIVGKERIDYEIELLAEKESEEFFSSPSSQHINSNSPLELQNVVEDTQKQMKQSHFLIVEIYNAKKKIIVEAVKESYSPLEDLINTSGHAHLLTNETLHKTHYANGRMYLQIFTPHPQGASPPEGFFEGVYEVDEEVREQLTNSLLWALVLVVISIFVTTIVIYPVVISLNRRTLKYAKILAQANLGMLEVLGGAIAKRDSDTNLHNFRVTLYSILLAEHIGITRKDMQALIKGAFLHDIGKIAISDTILLKRGSLASDEFETMKSHVKHGVEILARYKWLEDSVDIVRYHHEKFDGTGYLLGIQGDEIPVIAKIFAVTDVFDALTSLRPYKEALSLNDAVNILKQGRGNHFDPTILDLFLRIIPDIYKRIAHGDQACLEEILARFTSDFFSVSDARISERKAKTKLAF